MPSRKFTAVEGHRLIDKLVEAEVIPLGTTKFIIEADARGVVLIHYSAVADERLLGVLPMAFTQARVGNATPDNPTAKVILDKTGKVVAVEVSEIRDGRETTHLLTL